MKSGPGLHDDCWGPCVFSSLLCPLQIHKDVLFLHFLLADLWSRQRAEVGNTELKATDDPATAGSSFEPQAGEGHLLLARLRAARCG